MVVHERLVRRKRLDEDLMKWIIFVPEAGD